MTSDSVVPSRGVQSAPQTLPGCPLNLGRVRPWQAACLYRSCTAEQDEAVRPFWFPASSWRRRGFSRLPTHGSACCIPSPAPWSFSRRPRPSPDHIERGMKHSVHSLGKRNRQSVFDSVRIRSRYARATIHKSPAAGTWTTTKCGKALQTWPSA